MRENYLHDKHIFQAKATIFDSGTWTWVCSLKIITLEHMEKVLGNGKNTSLFFDRWVPGLDHPLITDISDTSLPDYILG